MLLQPLQVNCSRVSFASVSIFSKKTNLSYVVICNSELNFELICYFLLKGNESTPESMKASVVDQDEEGLPSPPLDDLAFFSAQTTSIELSQV